MIIKINYDVGNTTNVRTLQRDILLYSKTNRG